MNHPNSETLLTRLYQDRDAVGESDHAGTAEIDAHLAVCPECRQRLAQWRVTLDLLDEDPLSLSPGTSPRMTPPGVLVPMMAAPSRPPRRPEWLPLAMAAGVAVAAAFLAGRLSGAGRTALRDEVARLRTELTREISTELRATQQQDLARIAGVAVTAAEAGQRELTTALAADFNAARLEDRREFVAAIERLDRRRADEFGWLRSSFQLLADKTGGALEVTDTRLNALASALPATAIDGGK